MFNPFQSVQNYGEMLNKIAFFTFFAAILLVTYLRRQLPWVEHLLQNFNVEAVIADVKIPLGTIGVAFVIAALSRVLKLHDRLSDLFRIRQRFDIDEILLPMASKVGVNLASKRQEVREHRRELMGNVFYRYASSDPARSAIDHHHVVLALDQWSWYWVILETLALLTICTVALLLGGRFVAALITLFVAWLGVGLLKPVRSACVRYAQTEVEEIVNDASRAQTIRGVFRAL